MLPDSTLEHRRESKRKFEEHFLANLADAHKLSELLDRFVAFRQKADARNILIDEVDTVAALETLGIPLGAPLAHHLRVGLVLFRKSDADRRSGFAYKEYYDYGTEEGKAKVMKVLRESVQGRRILVVDEMIDSGGQFLAACDLIEECAGTFVAGLVYRVCRASGDEGSPPHPELEKFGYVIKKLDPYGLYLVQRRENALSA